MRENLFTETEQKRIILVKHLNQSSRGKIR